MKLTKKLLFSAMLAGILHTAPAGTSDNIEDIKVEEETKPDTIELFKKSKIAFIKEDSKNSGIWTIKPDGKDLTAIVTSVDKTFGYPSWSNGNRLAYVINHAEDKNKRGLYISNSNGRESKKIMGGIHAYYGWQSPSWSPDGKKLTLGYKCGKTFNLITIRTNGEDKKNLSDYSDDFSESFPSWSPLGTDIIFRSDIEGDKEIYLKNNEGTINLTNNPANESHPSYSPDGKKIAFISDRDGNYEIYVMNSDGSNQTRLTNDPSREIYPDWSPDGSHLTFSSNKTGNFEIYVMEADGSNSTQITNSNGANNYWPSWSKIKDWETNANINF